MILTLIAQEQELEKFKWQIYKCREDIKSSKSELKKALKKVNEKMEIYKTENDISLTKKILMVSILLANDLNKIEQNQEKCKVSTVAIEVLESDVMPVTFAESRAYTIQPMQGVQ